MMTRMITTVGIGFATLVLGAGLAAANVQLDPMTPLAGRPAGSNALDPMSAIRARPDTASEQEENEELGGLPNGEGAEDTFYQCTACHSTDIIKQQRVTDHRWDEMWTWMVERQGMLEPDEETKQVILIYLKQKFSSER